ncbi:LapA family protein [Sulfitobacter mediterraneus]|uniref:lipopolysaccharide assembly protein LapA domain-containing protein n=1 Tax=Sulfitobacter mediterraneus TaxID=83219 RepID=UPI001939D861|nr:LapA family protein [Sulfitobacter mediterraneus]MBM1556162.1 LapA family protein [Sulfitobacter mediterraneus]MBM1567800.1 LapA family protein [Sulfitobacter mediterraneus]MBM1571516.1 LapA family protein [Sulfitobacter mediterraneus]MBM1575304.1 LapA family protein [Sulfitobacter mediterraneus]MBM1579205.1 LapA family protein [Sulfitobacter mediterraneus]
MRYVRYFCIAIFAVALISVALANRAIVPLKILPSEVSHWFAVNPQIELPLFLVILGSIVAGLLVGFVWEWIREYGQRAEAARQAREMRRLEREVARLKGEKHQGKDEVLALLDEAS